MNVGADSAASSLPCEVEPSFDTRSESDVDIDISPKLLSVPRWSFRCAVFSACALQAAPLLSTVSLPAQAAYGCLGVGGLASLKVLVRLARLFFSLGPVLTLGMLWEAGCLPELIFSAFAVVLASGVHFPFTPALVTSASIPDASAIAAALVLFSGWLLNPLLRPTGSAYAESRFADEDEDEESSQSVQAGDENDLGPATRSIRDFRALRGDGTVLERVRRRRTMLSRIGHRIYAESDAEVSESLSDAAPVAPAAPNFGLDTTTAPADAQAEPIPDVIADAAAEAEAADREFLELQAMESLRPTQRPGSASPPRMPASQLFDDADDYFEKRHLPSFLCRDVIACGLSFFSLAVFAMLAPGVISSLIDGASIASHRAVDLSSIAYTAAEPYVLTAAHSVADVSRTSAHAIADFTSSAVTATSQAVAELNGKLLTAKAERRQRLAEAREALRLVKERELAQLTEARAARAAADAAAADAAHTAVHQAADLARLSEIASSAAASAAAAEQAAEAISVAVAHLQKRLDALELHVTELEVADAVTPAAQDSSETLDALAGAFASHVTHAEAAFAALDSKIDGLVADASLTVPVQSADSALVAAEIEELRASLRQLQDTLHDTCDVKAVCDDAVAAVAADLTSTQAELASASSRIAQAVAVADAAAEAVGISTTTGAYPQKPNLALRSAGASVRSHSATAGAPTSALGRLKSSPLAQDPALAITEGTVPGNCWPASTPASLRIKLAQPALIGHYAVSAPDAAILITGDATQPASVRVTLHGCSGEVTLPEQVLGQTAFAFPVPDEARVAAGVVSEVTFEFPTARGSDVVCIYQLHVWAF
jgi:hypothetical protein